MSVVSPEYQQSVITEGNREIERLRAENARLTALLARCSSWLQHYPGTLTEKWILADIERALGGGR